MSSSTCTVSLTIESEEIATPLPTIPKNSVSNISTRHYGLPFDLEMLPVSTSRATDTAQARDEGVQTSQRTSEDRRSIRETELDQVQTVWNPYWNRFRVLAACLTSFANGMNDSAPGALIASVERYIVS
jgi:phosphate/sulfate permease